MVFWPQLWFNESKQRLRGLPFVRCDSPGLLLLTHKKWDTEEHDRIVDTMVKLGKTLSDWGTGMSWLHFDRDLKYSIFSGIPKNGMDDHDEAYNTYSNYNIYIIVNANMRAADFFRVDTQGPIEPQRLMQFVSVLRRHTGKRKEISAKTWPQFTSARISFGWNQQKYLWLLAKTLLR